VTLKVEANHEEALEEIKRVKTFLEGKGVGVQAFWAASGGRPFLSKPEGTSLSVRSGSVDAVGQG